MAKTPKNQVPQSPPKRVEIRVDGRVLFANECYDMSLEVVDDTVKLTGALHPTMVNVTAKAAPEQFRYDTSTDPADGEEVLQRVHTGSRQTAAPSPKVKVEENP